MSPVHVAIAAVLCIFGSPAVIVWIVMHYRFRAKELSARGATDGPRMKQLEGEKRALESRIENLESIVCSVDFELTQRLNRLAAQSSLVMPALPAFTPGAVSRGGASAHASAGGAASVHTAAGAASEAGNGMGGLANAGVSEPELLHGSLVGVHHEAREPALASRGAPNSPAGGARGEEPGVSVRPPSSRGEDDPSSTAATQMMVRMGHLSAGQSVLGRYRIERELGRGGMGAVYLAQDSMLNDRVALKVIASILAGDPQQAIARFHREVQAARRVTHPNVIRIHDIGEENTLLFLSMEFVDGETLDARVRRRGPLPVKDALDIVRAIAAGIEAAHTAAVIHRDLKPQNVILGAAGEVKVIDFGLATTAWAPGMTATGLILGTPEYMAPEQVRGRPCDARTDLYSLAAIAHFILSGKPLFAGDTPIAVGFAHAHEEPTPLRQLRPEVPVSVETAVLAALAKDPAHRPASAAAWARSL